MREKNHSDKKENSSAGCCGTSGNLHKKTSDNSMQPDEDGTNKTVSFFVKGMTCMSCVRQIEAALSEFPGVGDVVVDLSEQKVTVGFDPLKTSLDDLKAVVETAGYRVVENKSDSLDKTTSRSGLLFKQVFSPPPLMIGAAAAIAVVGFYLGLITLVSDWYNARMQFEEYRWWILALAAGLGVQATLYAFLRIRLNGKNVKSAKSSLAASGGMSTASMAACCAHYLVAFLPALGLPFLSAAAAGLAEYQTQLFLLGVLSNLFGIGVMLRVMQKNGIIPAGVLSSYATFGLRRENQ
jgi:copper chaperone CopZ